MFWMDPEAGSGYGRTKGGCHEDQEMVPVNRISLAVKKQPVTVPVHILRIKEKAVELE
jgi:hypothetical protein